MEFDYKIGQDIYTIIKNGGILQSHKTEVCKIIIDRYGITYKMADNFTFGGLYSKCYRENGKVLKFKTEKEAKEYIEKININNGGIKK